jgi:hypothetical protein
MTSSTDKRALKILGSAYWSSSGWKNESNVSDADFAYAKKAGLMFDPIYVTHERAVQWAIASRESVSKEHVVSLFLGSLQSRRLDFRSSLGSFAVARNFPHHKWTKSETATHNCPICGMYETQNKPTDMNVLNFERFKWGGVRHANPVYIGFDLEQAAKMTAPPREAGGGKTLNNILDAAGSMPSGARLSDLERKISPLFPSNKNERRTLIGILGYCGILVDPSRPTFLETFPPFESRTDAPRSKDDWPYPVRWWRGTFGVSVNAVRFWFPEL